MSVGDLRALWALICSLIVLPNGFGKHVEVAGAEGVKVSLEVLFFAEISYTITITFVKFSILAFYWRIFNVAPIRVPIYLLAAITGSWGIACVSQLSKYFRNLQELMPDATALHEYFRMRACCWFLGQVDPSTLRCE